MCTAVNKNGIMSKEFLDKLQLQVGTIKIVNFHLKFCGSVEVLRQNFNKTG